MSDSPEDVIGASDRIVNGKLARRAQFPMMAYLLTLFNPGNVAAYVTNAFVTSYLFSFEVKHTVG